MSRFHRRLLAAILLSAIVLACNALAVVNGAVPFARLMAQVFNR